MNEIYSMSDEEFETVLKYLPQPFYAELKTAPNRDYSGLEGQIRKIIGDTTQHKLNNIGFTIREPSKELLLNIKRDKKSGLSIERVVCHSEDFVEAELTGYKVNISYKGKEPDYVSKIRQELTNSGVEINVCQKRINPTY